MKWKVWALLAGRSRMDKSIATYLDGMGESLVIPHTMFLLRGPATVVVDTSFESPEIIKAAYPQDVWRSPEEHPLALLSQLGVRPEEVLTVICTHLHYDHCGCNTAFRHARVLVQRQEVEYALNPTTKLMQREFFSPAGGFQPSFDPAQFQLLDGDHELGNGLKIVHLPGHTPGSQGVVVDSVRGKMCLAGDLIMLQENFDDEVPVGLHTDVDAWHRSHLKLRGLTDWVVPSHDLRIFNGEDRICELA